jgi:hypothetical protein
MTKQKLAYAQEITIALFDAVEKNNLIIAGKSEAQLSEEVCNLAEEKFGIKNHWHKKIVRTGKNTRCIYPDNPPDRIIQNDDIVILDFGPIVEGYEADIGRTYILGNDPKKIKIKMNVEKAWYQIQDWYHQQKAVKSSFLFQHCVDKAAEYGYTFGGQIAGHILGKYPHEQPADPTSVALDVHPHNDDDMFLLDANGDKRHWLLELLFIDATNEIGGYFEQLL